jgi:[CysO sulfur-carrier protein]-S-L-cysteine hydrolase
LALHLSASQAEALRRAATEAYPQECCGFLTGVGESHITISDVLPTVNVAAEPCRTFAIDPQAHFDLLRATRGTRKRVVGHYHSHPDGGPVPSPRDLDKAYDPKMIWVVIAVNAGQVSAPRAFHHPEARVDFVEVPVLSTSTIDY